MAIPTLSTLVATNENNLTSQIKVTFSVPVAQADLTDITADNGAALAINGASVASDGTYIIYFTDLAANGETITISFGASNTITAITGGESLAAAASQAVTNSIGVAATDAAQMTSAQVHTAVHVLAETALKACKKAC